MIRSTQPRSSHVLGVFCAGWPVVLVLEGVGRQVDAAGAGAGVAGVPADGGAVGLGVGQRDHEPVRAAIVAAQGPGDGRVDADVLDRLLQPGGQHRMRADLYEHPVARVEPDAGRPFEPYRPAPGGSPIAPAARVASPGWGLPFVNPGEPGSSGTRDARSNRTVWRRLANQ